MNYENFFVESSKTDATVIPKRPTVFDYEDFRVFLRDSAKFARSFQGKSLRRIAKEFGLKSPSHIHMILDGSRSLNRGLIPRVVRCFELNRKEAKFFEILVDYNQTKKLSLQESLYEKLKKIRVSRSSKHLGNAILKLYENSRHVLILEALGTRWATFSIKKMAQSLRASETEVTDSLNLLKELGLIEKVSDRWVRTGQVIETDAFVPGFVLRRHQKLMTLLALKEIEDSPPTERQVLGLTIALSRNKFDELQKMLWKFYQRLNEEFTEEDEKAEAVYQINLQAFPLLKIHD